jgi:hypothetical protein
VSAPPRCRLPRGVWTPLGPLVDAVDGGAPRLATAVELHDDGERLTVAAVADDPHPWATVATRDGDLYTEEVIELFLAPGETTPRRYFELEVNPLGAEFDAVVDSPHGDRRAMRVDRGWRCDGLVTRVEIDSARRRWRAELSLPWRALAPAPVPATWRLNVYRIDRPPGGAAEFSAWSPTLARPADFHRPARFGFLVRVG